ncbi:MAG: DUF4386 domain-containing protein [Gemmatimonadetes bacterium]|nr:DUF4386 domain-containing protein [Gemmatimonadota bacterium]
MQEGTVKWSDRTLRWYARAAGVGYLAIIATGIFAEFFVRSGLVVRGDASTTAANIRASEMLFRSGIASEFVMLASDVFVALALYVVFCSVNRAAAMLAAFFRLAHASIVGVNILNMYVPLLLVRDAAALGGFDAAEREGLALLLLETHGFGYVIGLVFFGVHCAILGYLVVRSDFVPRVLGFLLMLAAAGYLVDSFARALLPDYAAVEAVFTAAVFGPAFVAELSFALWLLIKGGSLGTDAPPSGGDSVEAGSAS